MGGTAAPASPVRRQRRRTRVSGWCGGASRRPAPNSLPIEKTGGSAAPASAARVAEGRDPIRAGEGIPQALRKARHREVARRALRPTRDAVRSEGPKLVTGRKVSRFLARENRKRSVCHRVSCQPGFLADPTAARPNAGGRCRPPIVTAAGRRAKADMPGNLAFDIAENEERQQRLTSRRWRAPCRVADQHYGARRHQAPRLGTPRWGPRYCARLGWALRGPTRAHHEIPPLARFPLTVRSVSGLPRHSFKSLSTCQHLLSLSLGE